jgi:hypothetical protein
MKRGTKQKFAARLKEEFDFDVAGLGAYVDEQSTDIITELVLGANLVSRIQVMEGVKGSEKIKLMKMDTPLQSAEACGRTPDGDMSVCNKTLKGTWAQMLLALGKRAEKENLPLEDVISAFIVKRGRLKNQDLMFKGDTASTNPDLVYYDGFIKKWNADTLMYQVPFTGAMSVTNAFARFQALANAIPTVLLDNGITPEIICSRADAQLVINNIYNDKDYASSIEISREGGEISFVLPTTGITVRSYPQLATGQVYAVPYEFMFFATDLEGDMDEFWLKYEDLQEKIYFGAEWGTGVQYVYSDYFGKIVIS